AEVCDRVKRDVGHSLAEHGVENEQIVDRAIGIADGLCEGLRRLDCETRSVKRSIKRGISGRDRAGRRMLYDLAEFEMFEEITLPRFAHSAPPSWSRTNLRKLYHPPVTGGKKAISLAPCTLAVCWAWV